MSADQAKAAPFDAMLARLLALHPKRIDLALDRMQHVLAALDHPERRLPPVIHVGGTNGKGSTIAFMRAILEAGGLAAHVYTSPHLVRFHERIRLGRIGGGQYVPEDRLADAFARCEAINGGDPITVFEITTAAALLFGALQAGGQEMQLQVHVPIDLVLVIRALIVLFVAAPSLTRIIWRLKDTGGEEGAQLFKGWG